METPRASGRKRRVVLRRVPHEAAQLVVHISCAHPPVAVTVESAHHIAFEPLPPYVDVAGALHARQREEADAGAEHSGARRLRRSVEGWWKVGGRLAEGWWEVGGRFLEGWWTVGGRLVEGWWKVGGRLEEGW